MLKLLYQLQAISSASWLHKASTTVTLECITIHSLLGCDAFWIDIGRRALCDPEEAGGSSEDACRHTKQWFQSMSVNKGISDCLPMFFKLCHLVLEKQQILTRFNNKLLKNNSSNKHTRKLKVNIFTRVTILVNCKEWVGFFAFTYTRLTKPILSFLASS